VLQVQVRQWECSLSATDISCVCGVAVREGSAVLILDMCKDNLTDPEALTYRPQHLPTTDNGGITVSHTGLRYKARLSLRDSKVHRTLQL